MKWLKVHNYYGGGTSLVNLESIKAVTTLTAETYKKKPTCQIEYGDSEGSTVIVSETFEQILGLIERAEKAAGACTVEVIHNECMG